jgi:hypothetical protein
MKRTLVVGATNAVKQRRQGKEAFSDGMSMTSANRLRRGGGWLSVGLMLWCGCWRPPSAPVPAPPVKLPACGPSTRLVGATAEALIAQAGQPEHNADEQVMPDHPVGHFGPFPKDLQPKDKYRCFYYSNFDGEQWHFYLVPPDVYQRIRGQPPGTAAWYVLESYHYPRGTVF